MYNIGICDDGKNTCAAIEEMILQYAEKNKFRMDIQVWYAGEELCQYLEQGGHLDILFLDIELIKLTGIEVGDFIRNGMENRGMQIIYISGHSAYAQKLFKTQPMDFLVKPITMQQIEDSLELAMKLTERNSERFGFQNGRDYYYISYGDILYFESKGRKIKIVAVGEEEEFYGGIRVLEKKLPKEFFAIHHSFVINQAHVVRYAYETVEMDNNTILSISKAYRKQVRERLLKGLS
ncbi:LytTR family DNA-binding domain-containing protein [uncultured Acetatifactor sp.]|uniref:LytR/AlgR family response regulator transcription factor n=2 Tax=uncultured Acetatifactor sp. TaxID=1671927 RepID=UPI0025E04B7F|nr:LytTR family DNA-binding domain-containing protein [uncultured Acetatifactor sp.]MCI9230383.1 response regulator transcription factor [Lachnospiraceae bacterium]